MLLTRRTNSLSPCFTTYLILRSQALVDSWIAHQTTACPNTWFTGSVLVGDEMKLLGGPALELVQRDLLAVARLLLLRPR